MDRKEKKQHVDDLVPFDYQWVEDDEEEEAAMLTPTYTGIAMAQVPSRPLNRAKFINGGLILTEKIMESKLDVRPGSLSELSQSIARFSLSKRDEVEDTEHRRLLWMLRSRVDFIIFRATNQNSGLGNEPDMLAYLAQRQIAIPSSVLKFTQITFWQVMMVLAERFNYLRYDPLLSRFLDCLYLSWAKFAFMVERVDAPRFINHPILSEETKNKLHTRINFRFMDDTERMFNGYTRRILFAEYFLRHHETLEPVSEGSIKNFFDWLIDISSNEFKDLIVSEFRQSIHGNHVWCDERERLAIEEKISVSSVTASRAIAQFRRPFIERMSEFTTKGPVKRLIERAQALLLHKRLASDVEEFLGLVVREVDVDFDLLVMICLKMWFMSKYNFSLDRYVWLRWEEDESLPLRHSSLWNGEEFLRQEPSKDFPMFIQYFNEIALFYKGTLHVAPDIVSCVAWWARLAHDDPDVRDLFPEVRHQTSAEGVASTKELYEILWPELNMQKEVDTVMEDLSSINLEHARGQAAERVSFVEF